MDGVIIDSMPYHFLAWYEALRPFGIRVSCFEVYTREGERWEDTLKDLLKANDIKPTKQLLRKIFFLRQKIFKKSFKRFIFRDIEELIFCLKRKGYLLGLVTGTPEKEMRRILPAKIRKSFDSLITGDKVKNGKPHPEPYLKAALSLGVAPSECMVIENAPLGIRSAKKAGAFCLALTTSLPREYLKDADMVVDHAGEIAEMIEPACTIKSLSHC